MKKNKSVWIIGGIILVVFLVLGVLSLSPFSTKSFTEADLKEAALTKYPGEIIRTAKSDNEYEIEMQMENGIYAIKMDANNGNILSLEQIATEEASLSVDKLSEDQIIKEIATQGELKSIHFKNSDTPYYEAIVHQDNVEITLKVDPYNGAIIDSTKSSIESPVPTENVLLSEEEALTIAANHLKGDADEDADLHQPSGQTPFYLVDVEIENGEEEDREAVVQIDAYTGTVMSVDWEN